ncbi:hypothetical protein TWF730_009364 [Orbilia blumenaviensis]|uniref:F-box domain-containing protein n=1 Tax=Orbilia blumenaviensis TaxID=1796055 RepID=A0AAV9V0D8_9PEZI
MITTKPTNIRTRSDVTTVTRLLCTRLPPELVLDILDLAEYTAYALLGSRNEGVSTWFTCPKTYLAVVVPRLPSYTTASQTTPNTPTHTTTEEEVEVETEEEKTPNKNKNEDRIKSLRITLKTHGHSPPQWYGNRHNRSLSGWTGIELWRAKHPHYKSEMKNALLSQAKLISINDGDPMSRATYISDPGDMDHRYNEVWEGVSMVEGDCLCDDAGRAGCEVEDFPGVVREYIGSGYAEEGNGEGGIYRVGKWIVQRNMNSKKDDEYRDYEVTWDADVDGPGPGRWLWDWEYKYKDENGKVLNPDWLEKGNVPNGRFVRELREGDILRITLRAQNPVGWCSIKKCQVEAWWA